MPAGDKPGRALFAEWVDGGREAQCPPNAVYPHGVDLDTSNGVIPRCRIELPYPALRCGKYVIRCRLCSFVGIATTAGRPDDPRSLTVACKAK